MHDGSSGGVYGALWQMGVWMDKGFEVQHVDIPIRQETIEICEFFNINPYLLDATGCLFVVVEDGEKLVEYLAEQKQAWVLSSWEIKIRRYPVMGEKICVETSP